MNLYPLLGCALHKPKPEMLAYHHFTELWGTSSLWLPLGVCYLLEEVDFWKTGAYAPSFCVCQEQSWLSAVNLLKMQMRNGKWILQHGLSTWAASSASPSCVDPASEGRCTPLWTLPVCSFSVGKSDEKRLAVTHGTSVSQNDSPSTALTLSAHSFTIHEMCRYFSSVTNFFPFPTLERLFKPLGVSFSCATSKAWRSTNREKLSVVRAGGSAEGGPALHYLLLKMWWVRSIFDSYSSEVLGLCCFFLAWVIYHTLNWHFAKSFSGGKKKKCLYFYSIHKVNKIVSLLL